VATAVLCEDLTHEYGDRRALDSVGLSVESGVIVGLLGPNGGGKTTLFKVLCTLLRPTSGRVQVLGVDALQDPARVRSRIGVVFQHPSVDPNLTVNENLMHQGHLYGMKGRQLRERMGEVLELLHLTNRRVDRVSTLSGGLKRRVDLAKGLLHHPDLLILDEPSTGLDPGIRREFWRDLERLRNEEGMTVLLTTHLMEEAERCDRVAILDSGQIVGEGVPTDLKRELGSDVITIKSGQPEAFVAELGKDPEWEAEFLDGSVVIVCDEGTRKMGQLLDRYRERIESITLGRPTLEDVFLQRTGRRFSGEDVKEERQESH
jgi:ABC-2 type transport system ATP-binding protein